jgi:hypothetical protein
MKKSILFGIVGIAATVAISAYGQGTIQLANYITSSNRPGQVLFGPGSGGTVGTAIDTSGYTVGLYWAAGSVLGVTDPTAGTGNNWGTGVPSSLNASYALAGGAAGTAALVDSGFGYPGAYDQTASFNPGLGGGAQISVMLVAYNGASYGASLIRGHSRPFTMMTAIGSAFPAITGSAETDGGFEVMSVPEPTTMALGGLGLAALMFFRRKTA